MSTTTTRTEFQSSELSRNSVEVFLAAEAQPVTVTRRDAEPLVLMTAREAKARSVLFEFAAQLIAITTDDRGTLEERMADHLPWMLALSAEDRASCATELVDSARASFATEQPHLAAATLNSWRETATAIAAGLGDTAVDWIETDEVIDRP